ncbi:MAG: hypothetical protein OXI33_18165 [Chloroflexota bacterium]|nr:hypothetical protein [Chloroflexota bacterium]
MIEPQYSNRDSSFLPIANCLNLTINPEAKDLLASTLKGRHEISTIIIPPTALELRAIAIWWPHVVSWIAGYQIGVLQVRSMQIFTTEAPWLDMLDMR